MDYILESCLEISEMGLTCDSIQGSGDWPQGPQETQFTPDELWRAPGYIGIGKRHNTRPNSAESHEHPCSPRLLREEKKSS